MQRLGVIKSNFPNIEVKAAVVLATLEPVAVDGGKEAQAEVVRMIKEFDPVFKDEGPLGTMKGDLMKIHIKKNMTIVPLNVCTPRKTPIEYQEAAKKKIDSDLEIGIIERVDRVSWWCSLMSFVPKPSGKVPLVVDLVQ